MSSVPWARESTCSS